MRPGFAEGAFKALVKAAVALTEFIQEIEIGAAIEARSLDLHLTVVVVDYGLMIDGRLSVIDHPGRGCVFTVDLPRAVRERSAVAAAPREDSSN